jgi:hypothetical protein
VEAELKSNDLDLLMDLISGTPSSGGEAVKTKSPSHKGAQKGGKGKKKWSRNESKYIRLLGHGLEFFGGGVAFATVPIHGHINGTLDYGRGRERFMLELYVR